MRRLQATRCAGGEDVSTLTLEDLEEELTRMAAEQDDENLTGVTASVQEVVKGCPEGASAIIVTDGEPAEEDEEEDDDATT